MIVTPDHRHTTLGRIPLDEGSARRRDLSLPDNTQHPQETRIHVARQNLNPQSQQAGGRILRGHQDRHIDRCRGITTDRVFM